MEKISKKMKSLDVRSYMMIVSAVLIWIVFAIATKGTFVSARNISNLLRQMSALTAMSAGMVFVLLTGDIDLSVGSFVTLSGVVAAALMAWEGWGTFQTILVILVMGVVVGIIHGLIVVKFHAPAFIVTLGAQMVYTGLSLAIGKGISIAPMADAYKYISQGNILTFICVIIGLVCFALYTIVIFNTRTKRRKYDLPVENMGTSVLKVILVGIGIAIVIWILSKYQGMPLSALIAFTLVAVLQFFVTKTKTGRSIYAVGGNMNAAYCAGINVDKIRMICFVICGVMAAIGGILLSSRLNCGSAVSGDGKETDAIAAAVIGGCSLSGGKGTVVGAILGALVMASLDNGMSLLNLDSFWQYIVKGVILIAAVCLDSAKSKRA